ncbi:MAG: nucleotidyltransferase [Flavobacteriales bacterium]|nr:nucleotidyltransferase [Flavobacteriales bacterium]
MEQWDKHIEEFISLANKHNVAMLMVGGGAVNFHGYQRHSADVDFWIEPNDETFKKLVEVFNEMGYEINDFPENVKNGQQNISVKFSPVDIDIELITQFSVNKPFQEAYSKADEAVLPSNNDVRWKVLNLEDLITSKVKAGRQKDLLDIQQLKQINGLK